MAKRYIRKKRQAPFIKEKMKWSPHNYKGVHYCQLTILASHPLLLENYSDNISIALAEYYIGRPFIHCTSLFFDNCSVLWNLHSVYKPIERKRSVRAWCKWGNLLQSISNRMMFLLLSHLASAYHQPSQRPAVHRQASQDRWGELSLQW